jgi:hypothetical protein
MVLVGNGGLRRSKQGISTTYYFYAHSNVLGRSLFPENTENTKGRAVNTVRTASHRAHTQDASECTCTPYGSVHLARKLGRYEDRRQADSKLLLVFWG